ncbi:DHH family phosphoesterase [Alkalithermobacter paradoxus]|uniref:Bifunctional oligoribonuclease and PAP phosphatase NrnA n=1 Tax=Alkalithermobacter paradoxus TaxID=29349 RepID=A0A1V4IB27_9FIRM|nr:bifunctional oligoribonuclease and PAP phosphatase NrnA [[Clostridium] thermoalcaliphilum]
MNNLIEKIKGSETIVITSHYSPDGDSIGSSTALYHALRSLNKEVYIIIDDVLPQNLKFLYNEVTINKSDDIKLQNYILVSLDCGDKSRLCCSQSIKENAESIINIDHHASNDSFGNINYVDSKASSTCELIYNIICAIDENLIDKKIGKCLYTGLITDTGNFMYSNATPSSFVMASNLINIGIDKQNIIENIYQSNPLNLVKLIGEVIGTLNVLEERIAYIQVTKEIMNKYNVDFNDIDGIVNYARDIFGVEVGILFKEKSPNEIKVSFRSKSYVNVNEIAGKFRGGGHKRASGCTINMSLNDAKEVVLRETIKYI